MDCGTGVQTRNVLCGKFEKDAVTPAKDESKCEAAEKPEASKECDSGKKCDGQWFNGPWSECSKKCGGGKRTRKVLCLADGKEVKPAKCGEDSIAFSSEDCNKEPCVEDELIPLDTTANPIEEDDESEEWCDEDEEDSDLELVDIDSSTEFDSSSSSSLFTDESMQSDSTDSTDTSDSSSLFGCNCLLTHFF